MLQWFQEAQTRRLTSHPGATLTSWSTSWTLIHPAQLRTGSTSSCGTHQAAESPCRTSGYCSSVRTITNRTGRSAWADTSPPPKGIFCWAATGWCQPHRCACLPTPSRTDQMLWRSIAAPSAHRRLRRGGFLLKACWMLWFIDREGQTGRHRSWVKLWLQDSCHCWRTRRFCLVMRPLAVVEAFTPMTCLLFQWVLPFQTIKH